MTTSIFLAFVHHNGTLAVRRLWHPGEISRYNGQPYVRRIFGPFHAATHKEARLIAARLADREAQEPFLVPSHPSQCRCLTCRAEVGPD